LACPDFSELNGNKGRDVFLYVMSLGCGTTLSDVVVKHKCLFGKKV